MSIAPTLEVGNDWHESYSTDSMLPGGDLTVLDVFATRLTPTGALSGPPGRVFEGKNYKSGCHVTLESPETKKFVEKKNGN